MSLSRRRVYHSDISLADASAAPVGLKPASSQPRTALLDRLTSRLARLGCRANGNKRPAGSTASAVLANRRGTAARSRSSASDGLDDLRGSRAEGGELGEGSVLTEGYPHHRPTSKVPARRCSYRHVRRSGMVQSEIACGRCRQCEPSFCLGGGPDPCQRSTLGIRETHRASRNSPPDLHRVIRRERTCGRSDRGAAGAVSSTVARCAGGRRIGTAASGHGGSLRGGWPMTLSTVAVLRPGDWVL